VRPVLFATPAPKTVIVTHHKPDADALGSSLGLYHYLKLKGIDAQVISPTDYGDFLFWMPSNEAVMNFEENPEEAIRLVEAADLVFCLDFNSLKRINTLGEHVANSKAQKVLIDHHQDPENFDDYRLWTTATSSTCELIFDFIVLMGDRNLINKQIADCLYAGTMTDTGSFRFDSTKPSTHRMVADLIEAGALPHLIHDYIFDNYSLNRTRFLGYCLNEKLELIPEYNTAIITINAQELKKYHIITGDTEGFVNFGLTIKGVRLAVLIVDRTVKVKLSFRSKGDFPTNEFSSKYFSGGGHFHASGGESTLSLEETREKVKKHLPEYKHLLTD
jgi:phosphoesterase RecJ-like protein